MAYKRYGSFPKIAVSRVKYDDYTVVDAIGPSDDHAIPYLIGIGSQSGKSVFYTNEMLIISVRDLAKEVDLELDGIFDDFRINPGPNRYKAGLEMVMPDFDLQIPEKVSSVICKWFRTHGNLVPFDISVKVQNDSTDVFDVRTMKIIGHYDIKCGASLHMVVWHLLRLLDLYTFCKDFLPTPSSGINLEPAETAYSQKQNPNTSYRLELFKMDLEAGTRMCGGFSIGLDTTSKADDIPDYFLNTQSYLPAAFAQLTFSLMQGKKFCASPKCGQPYTPESSNQRFCQECGATEAKRLSMQRYRANKAVKERG